MSRHPLSWENTFLTIHTNFESTSFSSGRADLRVQVVSTPLLLLLPTAGCPNSHWLPWLDECVRLLLFTKGVCFKCGVKAWEIYLWVRVWLGLELVINLYLFWWCLQTCSKLTSAFPEERIEMLFPSCKFQLR